MNRMPVGTVLHLPPRHDDTPPPHPYEQGYAHGQQDGRTQFVLELLDGLEPGQRVLLLIGALRDLDADALHDVLEGHRTARQAALSL